MNLCSCFGNNKDLLLILVLLSLICDNCNDYGCDCQKKYCYDCDCQKNQGCSGYFGC